MKLVEARGHWYRLVVYSIIICSIFFTGLFLNHMATVFYTGSIALILAIILLCSHKSNTVLGEKNPAISTASKTINIALWQIALFFSFLLFQRLALSFFNINSVDFTSNNDLLKYGLFPWPAITLISCGLAYIAYNLKKTAYFSSLFSHNHSIQYKRSALSDIGNGSLGFLSLTCISLTLGLLSLAFSLWFFSDVLAIQTGWEINSIITIAGILLTRRTLLNKKIQKKIHSAKIHFSLTLAIYVVLSGLIIGAILGAAQIILGHIKIPSYSIITYLSSLNKGNAINLVFKFWWLGWVSVSTLFIAKQYQGFSIRNNIISTLFLPALTALTVLLSNYSPTFHHLIEAALNSNLLITFLGIISTFGLIHIVCSKLHGNITRSSIMPTEKKRAFPLNSKSHFFKSISNSQIFLLLNIPGLIAISQGVFALTAFLFINIISITSFIILFRQETAETEVNDAE